MKTPTHGTAGFERPPDDHWRPRVEHVWVSLEGFGRSRHPGVLMAWRRKRSPATGWEGFVVYVEQGIGAHGSGPYLRQSWLDAGHIARADDKGRRQP